MTSALSGLVMLLSSCGGAQVQSDVRSETEAHDGYTITYSSQGFTIEGVDRHGHELHYSWSANGSSRLHLVRDDSSMTIRDRDGDCGADSYMDQEAFFDMHHQCVDAHIRERVRDIFVQHVCDLPVVYALRRSTQREGTR